MKRLRLARKAFGYTLDHVAASLELPARTVKAWEIGNSVPTTSELRDLAVFYGTSVNDLTGDDSLETRPIRSIHLIDEEGVSGFWGHLGVLLPKSQSYRWYAITVATAKTVAAEINSGEMAKGGVQSLFVETLNNRVLWINLAKVKGVCLCHDAEEWPEPCGEPDQEPGLRQADIEAHPSLLYPPEFYHVMTERLLDEAWTPTVSDRTKRYVDEFLESARDRLTDADLERLLLSARVWMADGASLWIGMSEASLKEAVIDLDLGVDGGCLHLVDDTEGYVAQTIPLRQIATIELPSAMLRGGAGCTEADNSNCV